MAGVVVITNLSATRSLIVIREEIAASGTLETTSEVFGGSPEDSHELSGLVKQGKISVKLEGRILSADELLNPNILLDNLSPVQNADETLSLTYNGDGTIATMAVQNSDGDTTALYTLTYSSGNLTQMLCQFYGYDGILDHTVTRTITYDGASQISSVSDEVS